MSMRKRVGRARELQEHRFSGRPFSFNSRMDAKAVESCCQLDHNSQRILKQAFDKFGMSARSYDRVVKVARTIADLEESEKIRAEHVAEAIQYRSLDRKYWRP